MNVAAVAAGVSDVAADASEIAAGGGAGALAASTAAKAFTTDAPNEGSGAETFAVRAGATSRHAASETAGQGAAVGSFQSHWQAVWAGLNAKTGIGPAAKTNEASKIDETEPQTIQGGASRTAAGTTTKMDQKEAAVATVWSGKARGDIPTGFRNPHANGSRPDASAAGSQRGSLSQVSQTAVLKKRSPAGSESILDAAEGMRISHPAKNGEHASTSANTEPQPLAEGTALVVPAAQQVMPSTAPQMPLSAKQFSVDVWVASTHESDRGSVSGAHGRSLHGTDALPSGNGLAGAATKIGSGNQAIAPVPQSRAHVLAGGDSVIDAAASAESEQPATSPGTALEPASAPGHALRADGQDSSSAAAHPSSGQAGTPAIAEARDFVDGHRVMESSQAAGVDNAGHRGADGSNASSLPDGATESFTERSGHTGNVAATDAQIPHISSPQLSAVEAPASMHVPVGGQAAAGAISGHGGETTVAGATAGDPFAALDSGSGVGRPSWIHAGGQRAEAGFEDPALGWVGVRADSSGGAVHAALVPGSAEAAQVLSAHLPRLSAYLSEQHTPVAALTMASSDGSGDGLNMQQSADQNRGQNPPAEAQTTSDADISANSHRDLSGRIVENGATAERVTGGLSGTYISVMA